MNTKSQKIGSQFILSQLNQIQSNKQATAYFYIILTFFTVSFFGLFALKPAFSTIANLQKQLADNQNVYNALQTKLSALHSLSEQYVKLEPNLPKVYNAIPTSAEIPTFTRQIEELATQNNLKLSQFTTTTIEFYPLLNTDKLYAYTFSLEAQGQQKDINNFLNQITNFNRIISIDKLITGKTDTGLQNLSLSGKAYFELK